MHKYHDADDYISPWEELQLLYGALDSRPNTLDELVKAVGTIQFYADEFVSCTCPPTDQVSFNEKTGEEESPRSLFVANKMIGFWKHCREVFTEDTIRAINTYYASMVGSIGKVENVRRNQPYNHLSVRPRHDPTPAA